MTATLPAGTTDATMRRLFPKVDEHINDPVAWVENRLGEHLWSKQRQVAESVRDHRFTAVPSCHGSGKSFTASRLVAWWLETHAPGDAFAVTTAPSTAQVRAILWREIGKAHTKGKLRGHITGGQIPEWKLPDGELVGYGRKPADLTNKEEAAAQFQGIHARFVLVVLDEACGVPGWLWDAVDTLATNDSARVLAIGNPDDPTSKFKDACAPGSKWNVIKIPAEDTPNFTGEQVPAALRDDLVGEQWVTEALEGHGRKSPFYIAKVDAEFPESTEDAIIPASLVRKARDLDLSGEAIRDPGNYGWDIARMGKDRIVGYLNRGGMIRKVYDEAKQTTDITSDDIDDEMRAHPARSGYIDSVGVGAGPYDNLRRNGRNIRAFSAGEKANEPSRYKNRRAEAWWHFRLGLKNGEIDLDPEDDELASQLQAPKFHRDARGRVVLETKEEMAKRGIPSPDHADAAVMSFLRPVAVVPTDDAAATAAQHEAITAGVLDEPM